MAQVESLITEYGMQGQLAELWRTVFGDGKREVALFFRNAWRPENTLAVRENGRIVSALHILPCRMLLSGRTVQAHYIYAAATLPEFRGRGYMAQLLYLAGQYGQRRGDYASVLLPASASLYDFYHKFGYRTVFGVRENVLSREELLHQEPAAAGRIVLTGRDCAQLRNDCLHYMNGSILWDAQSVQFALWTQQCWKRGIAFTRNGYCLYDETGVQELIAQPKSLLPLLRQAAAGCTSSELTVRLPVNSPLLSGQGKVVPHGMMRPLAPAAIADFPVDGTPYLGLTME